MAGGFQHPEKAGRMTRKMQSFYATGAPGGSVYTTGVTAAAPSLLYAGEDIPQGYAVAIGGDGLLYTASPLFADELLCVFVAPRAYVEGESVALPHPERVSVPGASFTPGGAVWLRDGTPNLSQTPLAAPSGTEDVVQQIGYAVTSTDILVCVSVPLIFE